MTTANSLGGGISEIPPPRLLACLRQKNADRDSSQSPIVKHRFDKTARGQIMPSGNVESRSNDSLKHADPIGMTAAKLVAEADFCAALHDRVVLW